MDTFSVTVILLLILSGYTWDEKRKLGFGLLPGAVPVMGEVGDNANYYKHLQDRQDLFDPLTKKLKPIREVVEDHSVRDFPRIIDCGSDERQNNFEADPDDCSCYFLCTGTYYVHQKCGPGTLFDRVKETCDWPELVDCEGRALPWTYPEYHGPATHNVFTDADNNYYRPNRRI